MTVPVNEPVDIFARTFDENATFRKVFTLTPDHRQIEGVIRLEELRSSGRFGFKRSELPTATGLVFLADPEAGKPGAIVFVNGYYASSVGVDERGDVWLSQNCTPSSYWIPQTICDGGTEPLWLKIGHMDPTVFARVLALRGEAARAKLVQVPECGGCDDCGGSGVYIYLDNSSGKPISIAEGLGQCQVGDTPAARTLVAWMAALREQAPFDRYFPSRR